jgi:outer membrane protein OmpA-like peptidoglycan-associated protein
MSGGFDQKPGGSSLVQNSTSGGAGEIGPGKRTLTEQLPGPAPVMRKADGTAGDQPSGAEKTVQDLANGARTPTALRAALAANPQLAPTIQQFFAAGNDHPGLNALLASAFPGQAKRAEQATAKNSPAAGKQAKEKDPTDPTQSLPADRSGDKPLSKGQLTWTLSATDHSSASVDVHFKPDKDKVQAKNVSFLQTVLNKVGNDRAYAGGTAANPGLNKGKFEKFEEAGSKRRVDHAPDTENDPFYGAEWDQANKKWVSEAPGTWAVGSSQKGVSSSEASMTDGPNVPWAREGKGDTETTFETVPTVLETREPLASLTWGFKIKDAANSPIELIGGEDKDAVDTPTADWGKTVDAFYAGKYETILDDYDIGKADLKPDHKTKLDDVAAKMTGNPALTVELGGACDLTGNAEFNKALSLKRAETARDYLVAKGIDAGRITVQSYSFDWARVEAEPGKSEGKNRRVQVLLR